jgi:hypothetical protein
VHPAHRGGAVTRDLVSARASRAVALGADRLWMRCVENSPSHRLALSHGWTWWARTEFEGPAALQQTVLLARPLRERQAAGPAATPDSTGPGKACQPAGTAPAGSLPAGARPARPAGRAR